VSGEKGVHRGDVATALENLHAEVAAQRECLVAVARITATAHELDNLPVPPEVAEFLRCGTTAIPGRA
jgi:hypothetical protein